MKSEVAWETKKPGRVPGLVKRRGWIGRRSTAIVAAALTASIAVATATVATPTGPGPIATATEAALRPIFAGTSFVNGQRTSTEIGTVKGGTGCAPFFCSGHGHEPEAARALGHFIHDNEGIRDGAVLREQFLEFPFRGLEREVSDVEFHISFV